MKVWSAIFNLIAVVIIAIMLLVINNIDEVNRRQFEEIRLSYAIDYAVEAAFRAAVDTDSIGTDYSNGGLEEVKVNPTMILSTFYNVLAKSYDITLNDDMLAKMEQSIATGVLCAVDGYYVLETVEKDSNPYDYNIGGEYGLIWGVKRPYIVYADNGNRLFTTNIVNQKWAEYIPPARQEENAAIITGKDYTDARLGGVLTEERVKQSISKLITEDINFSINERNIALTETKINSFYIPSSSSLTAVNNIKSPTLIIIFQDSTFLNGYDMDVVSIGGARVRVRAQVLGFTIVGDPSGEKYYCYAGQQLGEYFKTGERKPEINIVERLSNMHQAAKKGYSPHLMFLQEPYGN